MALSAVMLAGFELGQIFGCEGLVLEGGLQEGSRHGVRCFLAEILDEPQCGMDLRLRQVVDEAVKPLLLRHGRILHPTRF